MNRFCLLLVVAACGKAPSKQVPKESTYLLHLKGIVPGPDARLFVNGEAYVVNSDTVRVEKIPSAAPPILGDVRLEYPTPCGSKKVTLVVKEYLSSTDMTPEMELEERAHEIVEADVKPPGGAREWAKTSPLFADLATGDATLGQVSLKQGRNLVREPDCAPSQPIKFADSTTATFEPSAGRKVVYLVTERKETCYELADLRYGSSARGSTRTLLRDAHAYALGERLDYFLEAAPEEVTTSRGTKSAARMALTKVACP